MDKRRSENNEVQFNLRSMPTISLQTMLTIIVIVSSVSIAWGALSTRIYHLEQELEKYSDLGAVVSEHRIDDAQRDAELNQKIDEKYSNLKDRMHEQYDLLGSRIFKLEKRVDQLEQTNRESQAPRKSRSTP